VHDFNGGVQPSGLFWVVQLAEDAVHISRDGRRASVRADNVPVIDSFQFGGPLSVPGKVSYTVEWEAIGPTVELGNHGKPVAPTDSAAFHGEFAPALATGSFSGSELAFSFRADPGASTANPKGKGYAEIGRERNGVFL